jgi:molybdate transport system substrate-binding protein
MQCDGTGAHLMLACLIRRLAGALTLAAVLFATGPVRANDVLVFAAASLKTALDEVVSEWEARSGHTVVVSYAGSAQLARQIEQGAPADLFISASTDWMDYLQSAAMIRPETRIDLLGNRLVLIVNGAAGDPAELDPRADLAGLLGNSRLAMAMVDSVPAGVYGKAALTQLGLWDSVSGMIAQTDNVRAALALVASGEAAYGVVYATDAKAEPRVGVAAIFPRTSHPPIIYPAAIVAESRSPEAEEFFDLLSRPTAGAVFGKHGFLVLKGQGDG